MLSLSLRLTVPEEGPGVQWWARPKCCPCCCHCCVVVVVWPGAHCHHAMVAQPVIVIQVIVIWVTLHHSCHMEWQKAWGCNGGMVAALTWHHHHCRPYHGIVVGGTMVRKVCAAFPTTVTWPIMCSCKQCRKISKSTQLGNAGYIALGIWVVVQNIYSIQFNTIISTHFHYITILS